MWAIMTRTWWLIAAVAVSFSGAGHAMPAPTSHAAAEALVRVTPVTGALVVADTAGAAPILYDPADATVVGHAAAGWRLVEGLGRGRDTIIADRNGAWIVWDVVVPPGRARTLEIGILPLYPMPAHRSLST
jgi:FlaG/FlaF family flagellin (archaellin)